MAIDHGGKKPTGQGGSDAEVLEQTLAELERKVDRVRTLYEQYFMGIEKMEPHVARKEVTRLLIGLAQQHIRNTGQRFRFHSLQQKWNIYVTYWNRTMREIEAGTYRRDVARVTRKFEREGIELPEEAAVALKLRRGRKGKPADATSAPEGSQASQAPQGAKAAQAAPPAGAARAPARQTPSGLSSPSPPPGMTEGQMRDLYHRYVAAKQRLGAASGSIAYEALVATISKQTPGILQKFSCRAVDFDVVVREDKVILKPMPKKEG